MCHTLMPELPEISVFAKNLTKEFGGRKLTQLKVIDKRKLKETEEEFNARLQGQVLEEVYRSGKELRFKFGNGEILGMHVMISGKNFLFEGAHDIKLGVVELHFDNGRGLILTDRLKQANVRLNPDDRGGVDPLSEELTLDYLRQVLNKKTPIKNILLDQEIIRGIGGAYSDEICWEIRISPFSIASAIPDDKIIDLHKAIPKVLKDVEKQIEENKPGIISGDVRDFSKVHDKKKTHCPNGYPIQMKELGGRKTYFTEEQVLYK